MSSNTLQRPLIDFVPRYWRLRDDQAATTLQLSQGYLRSFYDALDAELATWEAAGLDAIATHTDPTLAGGLSLKLLAYRFGFRIPAGAAFPLLRRFLVNSARYREWKGRIDFLAGAIYLATGIVPTAVTVPSDANHFAVGVSGRGRVGIDRIGYAWRPEPETTFRVGLSRVGISVIGSRAIEPDYPYRINVALPYQPTVDELTIMQWVARLLMRAIDRVAFSWPATSTWWIVGTSRVGIDTIVGPGYFTVGISRVGLAKIARVTPVAILRIILPSGTAIEDV